MFEYRLQPAPAASKKVKGLKTFGERFAHALTESLNTEAKSGWEFVGQETFSVDEKSGMMKKNKSIALTYLVFRREIKADSVPLDQKLEDLKTRRSRTMIQAPMMAAPVAIPEPKIMQPAPIEPIAPVQVPSEPEQVTASEPFSEPFPEPMPTYVPDEPKPDSSRSLPFPGPAPAQTIGEQSNAPESQFGSGPTLNYDHSKSSTGASIDAPVLGPARRG